MKNQLQTLMDKEMSRVEFLQHVGGGLLVVFGLSGLVKAILQQGQQPTSLSQSGDYGESAYGGIS